MADRTDDQLLQIVLKQYKHGVVNPEDFDRLFQTWTPFGGVHQDHPAFDGPQIPGSPGFAFNLDIQLGRLRYKIFHEMESRLLYVISSVVERALQSQDLSPELWASLAPVVALAREVNRVGYAGLDLWATKLLQMERS